MKFTKDLISSVSKSFCWRRALLLMCLSLWFGISSAQGTGPLGPTVTVSEKKESFYQPTLALTGKYGKQRSFGLGSMMVPLFQKEGALFYANLRYMYDSRKAQEGNLGFGVRSLNVFPNVIIGAYGFLDVSRSPLGNMFTQGTIGFEFMTADFWDARINAYIPLSKSKHLAVPAERERPDRFQGYDRYVSRTREFPYAGFDLELGHAFPGLDQLRLYGAVYMFSASGAPTIKGGRLRMRFSFNDYFALNAEVQNDNVRKTTYFAGLTVTIPFGPEEKRPTGALEKRMMEAPERDIDIVSHAHEFYEKTGEKYYHVIPGEHVGRGTAEAPNSFLQVGRAHGEGTFMNTLQEGKFTHLIHEGRAIPLTEAGGLLENCLQIHRDHLLRQIGGRRGEERDQAGDLNGFRGNGGSNSQQGQGNQTSNSSRGDESSQSRETGEGGGSGDSEGMDQQSLFSRLMAAESEEDLAPADREMLLRMLNQEQDLSFRLSPEERERWRSLAGSL